MSRSIPAGMVLLLICQLNFPCSGFALPQQKSTNSQVERDSRADLPFRVYAQWAIDKYDANKDGSLTESEMSSMLNPLSEERFDQDNNGKLSFNEIVEAIRKPSAAKISEETATDNKERQDSRYAKFGRYVDGLIQRYDQNGDKTLSRDEMKKMRSPIADDADTNQDNQWSLPEVTRWLANGSQKIRVGKPTSLAIDRSLSLDTEDLAKRFLVASMKKNDTDADGKLNGNEIVEATWSGVRWQDSDTNNDGELSRAELLARYQKMFANIQRNTVVRSSMSHEEEKRRSRNSGDANRITNDRSSSSAKREASAEPKPVDSVVEVRLYLLRLPANSNAQRLSASLKKLRESKLDPGNAVQNLVQELNLEKYDQLVVPLVNQQQVNLQSGASVPMTINAAQTGRGRTVSRQMVDTGLSVELLADIGEKDIQLSIDLDKSDLVVNGQGDDGTPTNAIVNWNYHSMVKLSKGKPVLIGASSSTQHWILVVDAARSQ